MVANGCPIAQTSNTPGLHSGDQQSGVVAAVGEAHLRTPQAVGNSSWGFSLYDILESIYVVIYICVFIYIYVYLCMYMCVKYAQFS